MFENGTRCKWKFLFFSSNLLAKRWALPAPTISIIRDAVQAAGWRIPRKRLVELEITKFRPPELLKPAIADSFCDPRKSWIIYKLCPVKRFGRDSHSQPGTQPFRFRCPNDSS